MTSARKARDRLGYRVQPRCRSFRLILEKEKCCSLGPKKSACWKQFQRKFLIDARRDSVQLQRQELDLVVLASLRAMRSSSEALNTEEQSSSPRSNINYCLAGKRICKSTFLFIHVIERTRLENLIKHYSTEGLQGRIHKNSKKQPHK